MNVRCKRLTCLCVGHMTGWRFTGDALSQQSTMQDCHSEPSFCYFVQLTTPDGNTNSEAPVLSHRDESSGGVLRTCHRDVVSQSTCVQLVRQQQVSGSPECHVRTQALYTTEPRWARHQRGVTATFCCGRLTTVKPSSTSKRDGDVFLLSATRCISARQRFSTRVRYS
jgi:hypothetical protein